MSERGTATQTKRERGYLTSRILLLVVGTVAGFLLVEGIACVFGIDDFFMANALSYVEGGGATDIHRISDDPILHYDLNPGGHLSARRGGGGSFTANISALGARLPSHAAEKQRGIFRILCFGQSTMHGSAVDDDETVPAALERVLNQDYRDRAGVTAYEVWNFAVSGYNLAQAAHLARVKQAALAPDLILVQLHNIGGRPLFHPLASDRVEVFRWFEQSDHDLIDEQFTCPVGVPLWLHEFCVRRVAIYRIYAAIRRRLALSDNVYGNAMSENEARALVREGRANNVPVVFVLIPADHGVPDPACPLGPAASSGLIVDLDVRGREPAFYEVHPPAPILAEYGAVLAERLSQAGLLPLH